MRVECLLNPKSLCISGLYRSLDPPKSPLRRGTLSALVPPFLRGARGDRGVGKHTLGCTETRIPTSYLSTHID